MNSSCFVICELDWIVFMAIVKHFRGKMRFASFCYVNLIKSGAPNVNITGHTRNLIARTCPIIWPFDIPLKKTRKIFADRSISLNLKG